MTNIYNIWLATQIAFLQFLVHTQPTQWALREGYLNMYDKRIQSSHIHATPALMCVCLCVASDVYVLRIYYTITWPNAPQAMRDTMREQHLYGFPLPSRGHSLFRPFRSTHAARQGGANVRAQQRPLKTWTFHASMVVVMNIARTSRAHICIYIHNFSCAACASISLLLQHNTRSYQMRCTRSCTDIYSHICARMSAILYLSRVCCGLVRVIVYGSIIFFCIVCVFFNVFLFNFVRSLWWCLLHTWCLGQSELCVKYI